MISLTLFWLVILGYLSDIQSLVGFPKVKWGQSVGAALLNQTLMKAVPHKVWIPNFDKASELSVLFLIKGKDETAGESVFLNVNCKSKCNPLDLYKFI